MAITKTIYDMAASYGWYYEPSDDTWRYMPIIKSRSLYNRVPLIQMNTGHYRRVANSLSFQEVLVKTYHELEQAEKTDI